MFLKCTFSRIWTHYLHRSAVGRSCSCIRFAFFSSILLPFSPLFFSSRTHRLLRSRLCSNCSLLRVDNLPSRSLLRVFNFSHFQAALQGILFITELITYFLLSGFARNKWEAYALTTISWCLVNGADGFVSSSDHFMIWLAISKKM